MGPTRLHGDPTDPTLGLWQKGLTPNLIQLVKKKKIPPRQVTMHLTYILPGTGPFCPFGHRPLDPKCPTGHQTFMSRILAKLTFKGAAYLSLMAGVFRSDSGGSLTQNGSLRC